MKLIHSLFFIAIASSLFSQDLPRGLTDEERQIVARGYNRPLPEPSDEMKLLSTPSNPLRSIAEWEEMQAITITWSGFQPILREIVRHAKEEVAVIIVTPNESAVRNYLESNGIDLSENVEFVDAEYNTIWIRDYGANPAYVQDVDSLVLIDWIYNRPRPKDDLIPYAIATHLDVPIYGTTEAPDDLVNTGGNYMTDGLGRAFASKLVLSENGPGNQFGSSNHNEAAVNDIMQRYMGIEEYAKMTVLPYDAIHHIDMHMKLLDESTLLVGEYPEGIADGPQIEANIQYVLDQFKQATGRDYKLVRIPMPPDESGKYPHQGGSYRTYANALFVNSTILVPTYEEEYDTTGLRIWRETMPGYNIVGINCNSIIPLSGAIHCITKEVGVHRPLWISHHQPVEWSEDDGALTLDAQIKHISGISTAWLYYRIAGTSAYDSIPMTQGFEDNWSAALPLFQGDAEIQYYFKATAEDGKTLTRPIPAPEGYFRVLMESSVTGIDDPKPSIASFNIVPNPAHAITWVPVILQDASEGHLTLYNAQGILVKEIFKGTFPVGESNYFFDASGIEPGFYVLKLQSERGRIARALIVR